MTPSHNTPSSFHRQHRKRNPHSKSKGLHSETRLRFAEIGLTPETAALANERSHWGKVVHIHNTLRRVGECSQRQLAKIAGCCPKTVRKALQVTRNFAIDKAREAFAASRSTVARDILISRGCFATSTGEPSSQEPRTAVQKEDDLAQIRLDNAIERALARGQEKPKPIEPAPKPPEKLDVRVTRGGRLGSLMERCLAIAAREAAKPIEEQAPPPKAPSLSGPPQRTQPRDVKTERCIKMCAAERLAYLQRHTAPGRWREAEEKFRKLFKWMDWKEEGQIVRPGYRKA